MSSTNDTLNDRDHQLMSLIARTIRGGVVETLLAGNDTGCFTTAQYEAEYERQSNRMFRQNTPGKLLWHYLTGADHLRSLPDMVCEVRPDVWAAVDRR